MAFAITKENVWAGEIPDRPGGLADVLDAIAGAGGKLECVIARRQPDKPGTGMVFVTPIKGKKAQDAARGAGLQPATNMGTLRIEGPYRPDAGPVVGRAIQQAGINVRGVSGVMVGNKLVAYIGFDSPQDADTAAKAIKALGKKPARR